MLNAVSGVMRGIARGRSDGPHDIARQAPPATARHRRAIGRARALADSLTATPRARERVVAGARGDADRPVAGRRSPARRRVLRRRLVLRLTPDRVVPLVITLIVLAAAGVSLAPAAPVGASEGAASVAGAGGDVPGVRLAVGGASGPVEFDGPVTDDDPSGAGVPADDGTLYKPVAVDTSIKSSAEKLRRYTVKEGETLTAIASRHGVSMMTVWWANGLATEETLEPGKELVIPPIDGLVVTVQAGDTLEALAARNGIEAAAILEANELEDPNLIVGQVLMLPGAEGGPIPTARPAPKPKTGGGGNGGAGVAQAGGGWAWPVVGGSNYISQYFRYGHLGVDIAADYGSTIVSPLAGQVIFAGWKGNGGGYQVWISHGNGVYTSQNHMSAVSVSTGQNVSRGQRVGRVGTSGWASGSHDHLEVWIGAPWESGSYRVDPLRYY